MSGNEEALEMSTKLKIYAVTILPSLMYACEIWTVYSRHATKLNQFHMGYLRKLLNIKWQETVPDTAVVAMADITSIHTMLCSA